MGRNKGQEYEDKIVKILEDKKDYPKAISTVITEGFAELVLTFPLKQFVTEHPMLQIKVERELAAFSAWYELQGFGKEN